MARTGEYDDEVDHLTIDDLNYGYDSNSNLLRNVTDGSGSTAGFRDGTNSGDDYLYDDFGNLRSDANKNIAEISYNHLNLPVQITYGSGANIKYIYNAQGQKVRKLIHFSDHDFKTDYLDGYQYVQDTLRFFPHAEGYVNVLKKSDNIYYNYAFNYLDHLGNIRLTYGGNPSDRDVKILEENNYYPFGLKHANYNMTVKDYTEMITGEAREIAIEPVLAESKQYKYKYQGQEWQDELGLGWYSFKYRNYDPAIGRFCQLDPLAQTYAHNSPYSFAENNVTSGIDIEGLELSFHLDGNRATGQSGPYKTGGVNGNYTLQELRSEIAKRQAAYDKAMAIIMPNDQRNIPKSEIRLPSDHIDVARYDDPSMMMADGVRIGAEQMALEAAGAYALKGISQLAKAGSIWGLNALERGLEAESRLGGNLGNFPVIDKVESGVATSIKSMDLTAASYQKGNNVLNTLKGYINKLDNFTGTTWGGQTFRQGREFTSKSLELVLQPGKGTNAQWQQIGQAIQYAMDKNINLTIQFIK